MTHVDGKAAALMADHGESPTAAGGEALLCIGRIGAGCDRTPRDRRCAVPVALAVSCQAPRHRALAGRVVCGIYFYLGVKLALQER
jgi:hypothetical protein